MHTILNIILSNLKSDMILFIKKIARRQNDAYSMVTNIFCSSRGSELNNQHLPWVDCNCPFPRYKVLMLSSDHVNLSYASVHNTHTDKHTCIICFLLRGKNKLLFKLQEYWHFKMLYFYLTTLSWFSILLDIFKNINIFSPYKYWELLDQSISE